MFVIKYERLISGLQSTKCYILKLKIFKYLFCFKTQDELSIAAMTQIMIASSIFTWNYKIKFKPLNVTREKNETTTLGI